MVNPDGIPAWMRNRKRWINWTSSRRPGPKAKKLPVNAAGNSINALTEDSWLSFSDALNALTAGRACGLGFVLTEGDGIVGIDLDQHVEGAGALDEFASRIVKSLDSYSEYSVSRSGVHCLALGSIPVSGQRADALGIEIYRSKRYFTVTGHRIPDTRPEPEQRGMPISSLFMEHFGDLNGNLADADYEGFTGFSFLERETARSRISAVKSLIEPLIEFGELLYRAWNNFSQIGQRADLDASVVDFHVVGSLDALNWPPTDIAAAVYLFRDRYADDPEKAFRTDYVPRSIARARETRKSVPAPDLILKGLRSERLLILGSAAEQLLRVGAREEGFRFLEWAIEVSSRKGEFYATKDKIRRVLGQKTGQVISRYMADKTLDWALDRGLIEDTGRHRGIARVFRLRLKVLDKETVGSFTHASRAGFVAGSRTKKVHSLTALNSVSPTRMKETLMDEQEFDESWVSLPAKTGRPAALSDSSVLYVRRAKTHTTSYGDIESMLAERQVDASRYSVRRAVLGEHPYDREMSDSL